MALPEIKKVEIPGPEKALKLRARRLSIALAGILAVSFLFLPSTFETLPDTCVWHRLTGLPCPFCGLSRSVCALSHGSPGLAVEYHPFGPLVYAAGLLLLASSIYTWSTGREFKPASGHSRIKPAFITLSICLLWFLWWLAKMCILA
ncbi:MAG: DUF2752 domain-containing protein [Gemmatimonadota bacterium]|nr:DUF2752 domain-containing protein [Gemmatimonadota bacterium]